MDPGHVMTARGYLLNMDQLRVKSRRPLIDNVDHKDKVQPQKRPVKQLNMRGFMPSSEGVAPPAFSYQARAQPVLPRVVEPDSTSLADLTGVTVDSPRHLREKPANSVEAADSTLREIMGELDQFRNRETPSDDDAREKRRSKKT